MEEGSNHVEIVAADLARNQVKEGYTWILDGAALELLITGAEKKGGLWMVQGVCSDNYAISSITYDDRIDNFPPDRRPKSIPISFQIPAGKTLIFEAKDQAGNLLTIPLSEETFGPPSVLTSELRTLKPFDVVIDTDAGASVKPSKKSKEVE